MMKHKGDTWNESSVHQDAETGRTVRRVTATGLWHEKPTDPTGRWIAYHVAKDKRTDIYAVTV